MNASVKVSTKLLSLVMSIGSNTLAAVSREALQSPTMQNIPATNLSKSKITLLAITPDRGDCQSLTQILDDARWTVHEASSYREATRLIHESDPDVIVCERDLPDGSWKDVFREAVAVGNAAPVVVVSRQADDRFWAEVLNLGGYDVLLKPFEYTEVRRVMNMASRDRSRVRHAALEPAVA